MRQIPLEQAREGMVLARAVQCDVSYEVLLEAGVVLRQEHLSLLRERHIHSIYVQQPRRRPAPSQSLLALRQVPPGKAGEIYLEALGTVQEVFSAYGEGARLDVRPVQICVERLMLELVANQHAFLQLALFRDNLGETALHAMNVCILSLHLGYQLRLGANDMLALGMGALLHDLGKLEVPPEVLGKPGPLDDRERAIVRRHPTVGYLRLVQAGLPEGALAIVRDHHERCDGSGYPEGRRRADISPLARCVAVVDVYEAVTGGRPYRPPALPHEGLELLMAESAVNRLDREMVLFFLEHVTIYPVGCRVRLNDGRLARVLTYRPGLPTRPVLELLEPDGTPGGRLDLAYQPTILIEEVFSG